MKRLLILFAMLNSFTISNAFAQLEAMLNLSRYVSYFSFTNGRVNYDTASSNRYIWAATDDDLLMFGALAGDEIPDNPLEVALLTYYSPEVRNMRPNEAAAMLPANNPRLAGLKLGAAVYQEMQVSRFLADTSTMTGCEAMLRFVCERNGVTRADVETFYRNGIRRLVAEVVSDEFNEIRFMLYTDTDGCNVRLMRKGNQYTLICDGYWGTPKVSEVREFSGSSLDDLIQNMRTSRSFRDQTIIRVYKNSETYNTYTYLRTQAALIPAVVFASVRNNSLDLLTEILTNFYLNPNMATYSAIIDAYMLYCDEAILSIGASPIFDIIADTYAGVLVSLNDSLAKKVFNDRSAGRNSPRMISLPDSTQRVLLDPKVIEATRRNR